ncbi:RNA polymerase sigma factor [Anaeromyxobacter oryzae]|uniref:RNA polymerase sigma factor n=1 Tax=Anaeromyxobacter oryzae TaxID=2918170 RepID=UPI0020BF3A72|nr:RNA polymerase sigma factor [Anaeromyxobacter oryzae]
MDREELDALIARAQDGDLRAFEALLAQHLPKVRRFARAFAASEPDADDLAQEALLRVYRNLRLYRYQSAFSTWLYALVRNVFLDSAKGRAGRMRRLEEPLRADDLDRDGGARPDEAVEGEQERRRLWAALRQVPAEFRTALVLFDIEGNTYDEVAVIEGVAVGTVKSRLHRGRTHLRRLLDAQEASTGAAGGADAPAGTPEEPTSSHLARGR